jgi:hypothetical protein
MKTRKIKKAGITVDAEKWDALQDLGRELGQPKNWLSVEIGNLVDMLLVVAVQARKDAEEKKQMTEKEAKARYEMLARKVLEGK